MTGYTVIWDGTPTAPGGSFLCCDEYERVLGTIRDGSPQDGRVTEGSPRKWNLSQEERDMILHECRSLNRTQTVKDVALRWNLPVHSLYKFLHNQKMKQQRSLFEEAS